MYNIRITVRYIESIQKYNDKEKNVLDIYFLLFIINIIITMKMFKLKIIIIIMKINKQTVIYVYLFAFNLTLNFRSLINVNDAMFRLKLKT